MAYRVFAAPAEASSLPQHQHQAKSGQEFRRFRDALTWARALGRDMRAVLVIDEQAPAKVTVRTSEDAARSVP